LAVNATFPLYTPHTAAATTTHTMERMDKHAIVHHSKESPLRLY